MKKNKTQFALIVAAALVGIAQANADSGQFTPLENLSAQERASVQSQVETENPQLQIDWDQVIIGKNDNGKIEIRDKNSFKLQAISQPSCWN